MVKLDVSSLRYLAKDDFRVLTAVEMGMRNHELVPRALVYSISGIQNGSVSKILLNLTQNKLLSYERGKRYDGYRLTYQGYDFLALNVLRNRDIIDSVGNQIGVGKESDVYVGSNHEGRKFAIKFHRLGRTCFRKVSEKRDYQKKNQSHKNVSWIYLSRLAAIREFAFMKLLYEQNLLPVPEPIEMNRHCIVMELIDGVILNNISADDLKEKPDAVEILYEKLMAIIIKLTNEFGVVHGDFNEFNILIKLDGSFDPVLIDFPQMISINHELAEQYFKRDVNCIVEFFAKRFHYESDTIPVFEPPIQAEENPANHLRNLADAMANEEEMLKYSVQPRTATNPKDSSSCPFKDGKTELLSRFLDSLHQDETLFINKDEQIDPESKEKNVKLHDLFNKVDLTTNEDVQNKEEEPCPPTIVPSGESEKQTDVAANINNNDHEIKLNNDIILDDDTFDQKSQHNNSDVYSMISTTTTTTTFSPQEIKQKLIKENRKREIKQRMRVNPKKNIKGDANVMRRIKKDDRQLAKDDLKTYLNEGGF